MKYRVAAAFFVRNAVSRAQVFLLTAAWSRPPGPQRRLSSRRVR